MKLSISNIAWDMREDDIVGGLLRQQGVSAIELAPTKYWPAPCAPSKSDILNVRRDWQRRGQEIVAMQSLLYGCSDLSIFGDVSIQHRTSAYLERMIGIAEQLGARVLVFGSPRNRDRGDLTHEQALEVATEFFGPLAIRAADAGVVIGMEPNPEHYRCNFCTTAIDTMKLVQTVDNPGFGLNLDTGIAHLNGEDFGESIALAQTHLVHVHISEPELAAIGSDNVPHRDNAAALRRSAWQQHVSIEMRSGGNDFDRICASVALAKEIYHD